MTRIWVLLLLMAASALAADTGTYHLHVDKAFNKRQNDQDSEGENGYLPGRLKQLIIEGNEEFMKFVPDSYVENMNELLKETVKKDNCCTPPPSYTEETPCMSGIVETDDSSESTSDSHSEEVELTNCIPDAMPGNE